MKHKCVIIGGGTFNHISCHLSLAAPAFGNTAKTLKRMLDELPTQLESVLTLTKMADSSSSIVTNDDLASYLATVLLDPLVKIVIMNAAICDFAIDNPTDLQRLSSKQDYDVKMFGLRKKLLSTIRETRPDIVTVGFKTTKDASCREQLDKAYASLSSNGVDIVVANDVGNHRNVMLTTSMRASEGREDLLQTMLKEAVRLYEERNAEATRPWWVIKTSHGYKVESYSGISMQFFTMAADCKAFLLDRDHVYLTSKASEGSKNVYRLATSKQLWFDR